MAVAARQLCLSITHASLAMALSSHIDPSLSMSVSRAAATSFLSRAEASNVVNGILLPACDKGRRIAMGTEAQQLEEGVALDSKNPALFETYGEFPLDSLDVLLDQAEELLSLDDLGFAGTRTIVDVGSGCGRLAIYMALSRPSWDVYGIEISPVFHNEAIHAVNRAIEEGFLQSVSLSASTLEAPCSRLSLRCGPAQNFPDIFERADLIFCYSTAFESAGFSEDAATLLLGSSWSKLFANTDSKSLCITTDKALDPGFGWRIINRVDVENPEVCGSTGYIQRLTRKT